MIAPHAPFAALPRPKLTERDLDRSIAGLPPERDIGPDTVPLDEAQLSRALQPAARRLGMWDLEREHPWVILLYILVFFGTLVGSFIWGSAS